MGTETKVTYPTGFELAEFRPIAYYDKHMDCIRVVTHDRSVTEHRISEFFTLHEPNHRLPFDPDYVGFTIKGIRGLFSDAGIALDGSYKLAEIIDRLVKYRPGSMMSETLRLIFKGDTGDLSVEMNAAA
jgi:hypothetical protein